MICQWPSRKSPTREGRRRKCKQASCSRCSIHPGCSPFLADNSTDMTTNMIRRGLSASRHFGPQLGSNLNQSGGSSESPGRVSRAQIGAPMMDHRKQWRARAHLAGVRNCFTSRPCARVLPKVSRQMMDRADRRRGCAAVARARDELFHLVGRRRH